MFEIVAGELRAKLGPVSAMRQVRSGRDTCAVTAGPGCGAHGQRRGLAERPADGQRYKRRQTNAIQIASRGPLVASRIVV